MNLIDGLFSVARNVTDGTEDEINKLHRKAQNEAKQYASTDKGIKGLYARIHKGWLFQLILVFTVPLVTAWYHGFKERIMSKAMRQDDVIDDFERRLLEEDKRD